ncbi:MAG: NADP-dependent oxidoreductase [Hyphomicrobiales bacterium]|nr:NADP-dependent oxidoreductase [Hyphomicrobiales bacterium]MCP5000561.1 NADP-dependent oxidoreductase [Hyphomicrobiales bacterium]
MTQKNRRIVLASRPTGPPVPENFRLEEVDTPPLADGEMLLHTLYLSLDPYMRGRMNDAPSYAPPTNIDEVMTGGTVARVEASNNPKFAVGDLVLSPGGWQEYSVSDGTGAAKLDRDMPQPSLALGVMGMPGFTAYVGLLDIGEPKPGETVVVSAASGAVGSAVGQIAKLKGCRVVGVAGSAEKCSYAVEELGFDACIDRHEPGLKENLAAACPDGVDVYFENVGGAVFDAVLPLLNVHARIPVCGRIASYNATSLPDGPDRSPALVGMLLVKRIKMQGFIIFDHYERRYRDFVNDMTTWLAEGKIKYREDVVDGLENAPEAFMGLLEGRNFGKLVVRTGAE